MIASKTKKNSASAIGQFQILTDCRFGASRTDGFGSLKRSGPVIDNLSIEIDSLSPVIDWT